MFRVLQANLLGQVWYAAGAVIPAGEIPADRAKRLVREGVLEPIAGDDAIEATAAPAPSEPPAEEALAEPPRRRRKRAAAEE